MIHLAICDDEHTEIEYLNALICQWAESRGIAVRVSSFENPGSFLFSFEDVKAVDILLLDIRLNDLNGVKFARRIRKDNETVQIIFITGFPDFMAEGYDVEALNYLIKPVRLDKFSDVLNKAVGRLNKVDKILLVETAEGTARIGESEIIYIEAFAHSIVIQTQTAAIDTKTGIGMIEKKLGGELIRCHRSYIVGLRYIRLITKTDVVLDTRKKLPLSRNMYKDVNRAFIEYYRGRK